MNPGTKTEGRSTIYRETLLKKYQRVRQASIAMCEPLQPEDFRIQPMLEASPPWWTLGHTSWFFAQMVLRPFSKMYADQDKRFNYALNSYYVSQGERVVRPRRGLLTRPTTTEIYRYRESVDERMEKFIKTVSAAVWERIAFRIQVGIHHEQQHQELFYTEIKLIGYQNPLELREPYQKGTLERSNTPPSEISFIPLEGGLTEIGYSGNGFCFDNELPPHKYHLRPFEIMNRLVTNGEYLDFMEDGGYTKPMFWLFDGWDAVQKYEWTAPLYWEKIGDEWWYWTLRGMKKINWHEPVCHVSFYEAHAFARWKSQKGLRLPTEQEWEYAAQQGRATPERGNFLDVYVLHPTVFSERQSQLQFFGNVWKWTTSHYEPYPGYQLFPEELEEYNGKFTNNQRVLRGGSCVTERDHIRATYRNFWYPETRFQFTGILLAR